MSAVICGCDQYYQGTFVRFETLYQSQSLIGNELD